MTKCSVLLGLAGDDETSKSDPNSEFPKGRINHYYKFAAGSGDNIFLVIGSVEGMEISEMAAFAASATKELVTYHKREIRSHQVAKAKYWSGTRYTNGQNWLIVLRQTRRLKNII